MQFSERKVAQMAAYLLSKAGGRMSHMKLLKLLYLTDRESLNRYDEPITGDRMVAMPHGPVLSRTYDHINGNLPSIAGGWSDLISDRAGHQVGLRRANEAVPIGALSEADTDLLDEIWDRFGGMSQFELSRWTHEHCKEWSDPHGSAYPIDYREVMVALGRDLDAAKNIANNIEEQRAALAVLAAL